ncbi:hypothetical protein RFI_13098 [Reticulomyxa filosa]|uniref:Uncharacterized protein n=1 Tax=Reticulomyxa filosa TaxID=46433 RepID=X6NDU0_RETFI|nr:hypothetical protein RFI_13098 [Reticulomyxa filosa]|eukprot:ETO24063.1 hypothetical protein RFI_13098 [Reticulomyxa filosa]
MLSPHYFQCDDMKLPPTTTHMLLHSDEAASGHTKSSQDTVSLSLRNDETSMLTALTHPPILQRMLLASCGEDGLVQLLSLRDARKSGISQHHLLASHSVPPSQNISSRGTNSEPELNQNLEELVNKDIKEIYKKETVDSNINTNQTEHWTDWKEMQYGKPFHHLSDSVDDNLRYGDDLRLLSEGTLQQPGGGHFPFKCFDIVKRHDGKGYLLFAAGAKEFLQAFEITPSRNGDYQDTDWKALCFTGGDKIPNKRGQKQWLKSNVESPSAFSDDWQDPFKTMDLRIKKFEGKWLVITGNSIGVIRAYTLDEEKPDEFQFEGEDSALHHESNHGIPILSLASTYSCIGRYYFPDIESVLSNNNEHQYSSEEVEIAKLMQHFITNFGRTPKKTKHIQLSTTSVSTDSGNSSISSTTITSTRHNDSVRIRSQTSTISQRSSAIAKVSTQRSFHSLEYKSEKEEFAPSSMSDSRIIPNYQDLPPHLIFSGSINGCIHIWFWDVDTHSLQLLEKFKTHLSGVNTISVSWLDPTFVSTHKQNSAKQNDPLGKGLKSKHFFLFNFFLQ